MIDSWAWIEFYAGSIAGENVKVYVMDDDQDIIISTINLAEIYRVALHSFDEEIAVMAAKIKHDLKWGLDDALIYATAKREGARVLTSDIHFKGLSDIIYLGM